MIVKPSREGYVAAYPNLEDPGAYAWGPTKDAAETEAHKGVPAHMRAMEGEQTRLAAELAEREWAEFLTIRAQA